MNWTVVISTIMLACATGFGQASDDATKAPAAAATATPAAMAEARNKGAHLLAICNVIGSMAAR
jgi:hypothetical protein